MSLGSARLRGVYKLSEVKKAFSLPEEELLKAIAKANRGRGFFMPADRKAFYEKKLVLGHPCLVVRARETPAKRAILFFFGGGMVIGPDKGDAAALRKLCFGSDSDVWFPIYPLCTEYCITESYAMAFECYREMIGIYGGGNVSTCGFSSGGALALGMAAHNSALGAPLPQPRHIIAVDPGEVPWNNEERARMLALNPRDVAIDYAFLAKGESSCAGGGTMRRNICSPPPGGTMPGRETSIFTTAGTRSSTARCRSSRPPVTGRGCPIPSPPGRG